MSIPAIGSISSIFSTGGLQSLSGIGGTDAAASSSGASFGSSLASAIGSGVNSVQSAQSTADNLAVKAATGDLTDIQNYTIASAEAGQMTDLAVAIRNKGLEAFQTIMGMQA